jgi:hypothetical protein
MPERKAVASRLRDGFPGDPLAVRLEALDQPVPTLELYDRADLEALVARIPMHVRSAHSLRGDNVVVVVALGPQAHLGRLFPMRQ